MSLDRWKRGLKAIEEMEKDGVAKIVDDDSELLAKCDFGVCIRTSEDALAAIPEIWVNEIEHGVCINCSHPIFFRNNMPKDAKKICYECATDMMDEEGSQNTMIISRKSGTDELKNYIKKKEQN